MTESMTRERLERYRKDQADMEKLRRAASRPVGDKVRGSLTEYPYTEVSISIVGLDERLVQRYREKKRQVEQEGQLILAFLEGMEDLFLADLIRKRYLEKKSWVDIWKDQQCNGTIDAYRMMVRRYLGKL